MSESTDTTITLNVRLKPTESAAHPRATNYSNVGVVQGIAYVDFGFIEPTLLAAIAQTAKPHRKVWRGILSPASRWISAHWDGCINKFSKCSSLCKSRNNHQRSKRKRKEPFVVKPRAGVKREAER